MSTFPRSPKVLKGALVGIEQLPLPPRIIVFQYNPDSMERSLSARTEGENENGSDHRTSGPPRESISLNIELDATDQLENNEFPERTHGLHPALASLELLMYPASAAVIANNILSLGGMIEVIPPKGPLTLLIWNPNRVLPVKLKECRITETAFDPLLNPIQAEVSLSMDVLTYEDLGMISAGGKIFMVHHISKEVLSAINQTKTVGKTILDAVNAVK